MSIQVVDYPAFFRKKQGAVVGESTKMYPF